jgi:5'-3' exoribonuclease 1
MGVPKFYRWICEHYPLVTHNVAQRAFFPNFDNFYLDMNGIIHTCSHPSDDVVGAPPVTERDLILGIFRFIDKMVTDVVRPRKVLFMAIDGVAPRAKLNQQRSRRFRADKDRTDQIDEARGKGIVVNEDEAFDSNCITPGTDFMMKISTHIEYYIQKKIKEDPLWQNLLVIFSGHNVPGEGEHKIMDFIREQKHQPGYDPNTTHCMYGQDADLIMLSLVTHEPHFCILREAVNFNSFIRVESKSRDRKLQRSIPEKKTTEVPFFDFFFFKKSSFLTSSFSLPL